ncbi:hypothetical protein [Mucilaginibacter arboris]|uniref:Uncharacterized protein n=1 Tax=Mucilaginibacter arboris TaxID=2682090 RepID=A0A7K1T021_9SPHI|nr:hypothetical protein [Mucilaginibacter arboris]MVN22914.1 hypothetical protein [Mucilaginibacter arboris]
MNTEAMNVLKQIRETTNQLQEELDDPYYQNHTDDRILLESMLNNLYDQEDLIINNTIQNIVQQLNEGNNKLQLLIDKMSASSNQIAKLNVVVKKVSDIIAALVKITTVAVSAGLL